MMKVWIVAALLLVACNRSEKVQEKGDRMRAAADEARDKAAAAGSGSATAPAAAPEKPAPPFIGSWKLDSVTTKDGPVPNDKLSDGGMTWTFQTDGTVELRVWAQGQERTSPGTWVLEKDAQGRDVIAQTENGQTSRMTYELSGEKLTLVATESSVRLTFVPNK
jgi:hypothetical protein